MAKCSCNRLGVSGHAKDGDDSIPVQAQYLTEGCCPNRCGPLSRSGEASAFCKCCKLKWKSERIRTIWYAG